LRRSAFSNKSPEKMIAAKIPRFLTQ